MSLSVIVPAFNAARTIEACLRAIRSAAPSATVIVVDDASTDQTAALAAPLADHVIAQPANAGPAAARRAGSERADKSILAFIDADVLVRGDTFDRIENFFAANPGVDAVTGLLAAEHPNPGFWSQYKNLYMNYIFSNTPDDAAFIFGSVFAIRRGVANLLPNHGRFGEDTAMGQTLVREGRAVRLLKDVEVVHLKGYTLASFLKNDFRIPYAWGRLFARGGWRTLGRRGAGFAHASRAQLVSLTLAPLTLAALFYSPAAAGLLFAVWSAANIPFLSFFARKRGAGFALASWPATFVDHLTMALGAAAGICFAWRGDDR